MSVELQASVDEILGEEGQTVTLTRLASGAYNPATSEAAITTTTQTASAVILPFSQGLRKQSGSSIKVGERLCYLSALKTDGTTLTPPEPGDTITDAGATVFTVVDVTDYDPTSALTLVYELTLKGVP